MHENSNVKSGEGIFHKHVKERAKSRFFCRERKKQFKIGFSSIYLLYLFLSVAFFAWFNVIHRIYWKWYLATLNFFLWAWYGCVCVDILYSNAVCCWRCLFIILISNSYMKMEIYRFFLWVIWRNDMKNFHMAFWASAFALLIYVFRKAKFIDEKWNSKKMVMNQVLHELVLWGISSARPMLKFTF